ncbi:MAG: 30S ribosomal protein S2 [Patescibacteria group bacterium]|jgi:small subunit ribosomal protein S2
MTTTDTSLLEMLQAGVHFGHRISKRHPKMNPFIFGVRNGISIIDLEKTKEQLDKTLIAIEEVAAQGKTILFLGTKRQIQPIVKSAAEAAGMPYVVERWLGGLLTNYQHVRQLMKKLTDLKEARDRGEWTQRYTKKERLVFEREIDRLENLVGGIESIKGLPDMLMVFDCKKEKTAIAEAARLTIPIAAITDTNINPTLITYPIPANDDGIKSVTYIATKVAEAVKRGQARIKVVIPPTTEVKPALKK